MPRFNRFQALPLVFLLLCACGSSDDDEDTTPEPAPPASPEPQRGELIGEAPTLAASYSPDQLLSLATSNEVAQVLSRIKGE